MKEKEKKRVRKNENRRQNGLTQLPGNFLCANLCMCVNNRSCGLHRHSRGMWEILGKLMYGQTKTFDTTIPIQGYIQSHSFFWVVGGGFQYKGVAKKDILLVNRKRKLKYRHIHPHFSHFVNILQALVTLTVTRIHTKD